MKEIRDDPRNVIDFYKYWRVDAIKADLREKCHNFSVLVTNKFRDFNLGGVIRNSNAFLAKEVIVYGSRQYDRRGTVGAHLYTNLNHVKFLDEVDFSDSVVIGFDNMEEAKPLETFVWPDRHVIMAFGEETVGLTEEVKTLCDDFVYIKQYGSVRSLNVGCASAIAMYDYCLKLPSTDL